MSLLLIYGKGAAAIDVQVSWVQFDALASGSPDVSVALSGASVTTAVGTLAEVQSLELTGSSVTPAAGTIVAQNSNALTGESAATSSGSVSAQNSNTITGESLASETGSVTIYKTAVVSGAESTVSVGVVTVSTEAELDTETSYVEAKEGSFFVQKSTSLIGAFVDAQHGVIIAPGFPVLSAISVSNITSSGARLTVN
jgi:hypothetical protein